MVDAQCVSYCRLIVGAQSAFFGCILDDLLRMLLLCYLVRTRFMVHHDEEEEEDDDDDDDDALSDDVVIWICSVRESFRPTSPITLMTVVDPGRRPKFLPKRRDT